MIKKNHIMYWSPSLVNIATKKAVINSAISLKKYDKIYDCTLLNFFGEHNVSRGELEKNGIKLLDYYPNTISNFLPRHGKIKSRISFIFMVLFSFFPLKKIIKKQEPDYLIVHLLTSLPLFLLLIFNFKTKFILRISGLPKLSFLRKKLWQLAFKKIYCVTCPTETTMNYLKSLNIIEEKKLKLLHDPIINVSKYSKKKLKIKDFKLNLKSFYLAVGRLTRQKNFLFLCEVFNEILKRYPEEKLLIAGEGEDRLELESFIKKYKLEKSIFLIGYKEEILKYFSISKGFILSSLWEDPGFVLIEAAMTRTFVLSSDCPNGPKEIIKDRKSGISFKNNDKEFFLKKFEIFKKLDRKKNQDILLNNLLYAKRFTIFNHYKILSKILEIN